MKDEEFVKDLAVQYCLGNVKEEVVRVYGGLLHKSYKLSTDNGDFFVKIIGKVKKNKSLISRLDLLDKYENMFFKNKINAVYALEFLGHKYQIHKGVLFYIFPWTNYKPILKRPCTKTEVKKIAKVNAQITNIDIIKTEEENKKLNIDWKIYLDKAKNENKKIYDLLKQNIKMLEELTKEGNEFVPQLPKIKTLAHNDMDRKNVVWKGKTPILIDLECITYNNPYLEAFINALYWSGYEVCDIDFNLYTLYLKTYFKKAKISSNIDLTIPYYASFLGLEWLEFNLKRALRLIDEDEEEQKLGESQTVLTINQIVHYYVNKDKICLDLKL